MFNRKDDSPPPDQVSMPRAAASASRTSAELPSVENLLVPGEELVTTLETDNRTVAVTSQRLVIVEQSGGYSVIPRSQIAAFEVSPAGDGGVFVKVFFGGGLSRTLKVRSDRDASILAGVVAL
jgi:hypothetical protein